MVTRARPWFIICSQKSNFSKHLQNSFLMASSTYKLSWSTPSGEIRERTFFTFSQMRSFRKRELKMIECEPSYSIWNGSKYEKFVIISGKLTTHSMLLTYIQQTL